jgi:hypothetical protein
MVTVCVFSHLLNRHYWQLISTLCVLQDVEKGTFSIVCCFQACWVLHYFSEIKFKEEAVLAEAIRLTTNALLTDQDLPVKVEAAIALQMLLNAQEKAQKYVEPQVFTPEFKN